MTVCIFNAPYGFVERLWNTKLMLNCAVVKFSGKPIGIGTLGMFSKVMVF